MLVSNRTGTVYQSVLRQIVSYHIRINFENADSLTSGVDTKGTSGGAGRATVTLLNEVKWLIGYH